MPITSFPTGTVAFGSGGVLLKEVPLFDVIAGNVFWVDSGGGGSTTSPGTFLAPRTTLDSAVGLCTANNGDVIFAKPGHAETYTAAGSLALDVAGIKVICLGHGNDRATITMDNTAATISVSAADVTLAGLIIKSSVGDLVTAISLAAGGIRFVLDRCSFVDDAATDNFVDAITMTTTDNAHDGLTITGCDVYSDDTGNDAFLVVGGNLDRLTFANNRIHMGVADNEQVIEVLTGKNLTQCYIVGNTIQRDNIATTAESGDIFVGSDTTANTGIIAHNLIGHLDPLAESVINVTGVHEFQNFATGVVDKSGYLLPAADSSRTAVPCNGCTACCRGHSLVAVHAVFGDVVSDFDTEKHEGATVLRRKDNGDCIYLADGGCSIWDRAPSVCKAFDCRRAVKLSAPLHRDVYEAAVRIAA